MSSARIQVQNRVTGFERQAVSNEQGLYFVPLVPVGSYSVRIEHPGFRPLVREGIAISVNQEVRVDLSLSLASSTETVTVTGDAAQVSTNSATVGAVVKTEQIVQLPLNGRNFTELGALAPGVVTPPQRLGGSGSANAFAVNGLRTQSNSFILDGATNSDPFFNGYVMAPPPDAIQEFKLLTSGFAAEYGFQSGSAISVITRAGGNSVHGSLWEFLRNDAMDARNFFAASNPQLNQNQFGGSLGGPILRNRTFVYAYYEATRIRQGLVQNVPVLTDAQRGGDFGSTVVRDPQTNQAFPNNRIPTNRLNPIAARLLGEFVPGPNSSGARFVTAPASSDDRDQFGVRIDHRFSNANALFARYSFARRDTSNPLGGNSFTAAPVDSIDRNHSVIISDTHVFSPTLFHEVNLSFLRQHSLPTTWSGLDLAKYGWLYSATEPTAMGLPNITVSGLFTLGESLSGWSKAVRNIYQIADSVTWIHGRHNLKAGADLRRQQIFQVFPNRTNGDFTFNGQFTGSASADFLLGLPVQFRQNGGDPSKHFVGDGYGLFVQDEWKVSPRLTLNLGLRWELPIPFVDKQNRIASFQPGRRSVVYPDAPAGLVFPGDPGVSRATIDTDYNNFAPRFGFAWDVFGNGHTSVRGSYGVFFDTAPGTAVFQSINLPPFNRFLTISTPDFANPYSAYAVNPQTDPSRRFPTPTDVIGFSPDVRTPYAQQINFNLQRQISSNLMAEVGYVGTLGRKMWGYLEVNPAIPGPGATVANQNSRRVYPGFGQVRPTFSNFNSAYHGLQTRLEKRFSGGLTFLAAYTFSKAIDYQSSVNLGGDPRPQDGFSLQDVRGLALFDVRHRAVASWYYQLPALPKSSRALRVVAGGWAISGILSAQSGNPFSVTESVDYSLRAQGNRPDLIRDPNQGPRTAQQWFDTSAFVRLTARDGGQRFGTAGRNVVIGPGILQTDLAVLKSFPVWREHHLDLRFEAFNLLNHTNFFNPESSISTPQTFGSILSSRPARVLQLGAKYTF